ncbi:MAG: alpha/beta fold hydrolase [Anaerolineae bacterium]|nr:alpha/beta fold hydrolase [Anaerolineae bacterium]
MSPRLRRRSWRFFRNQLLYAAIWAAFFLVLWRTWVAPFPWIVYILGVLPAYAVGAGIFYGYRMTHPRIGWRWHTLTPGDAGLPYEKVEFPSRDGLLLFGWYIPGRNRAAVVLVHGGGSQGIAMLHHAAALATKGFGALMFDLRAHGSSEGDTCTAGWREVQDLLGAVDYVRNRPDVDEDKIGVLGLSLGAQIALRSAAQCEVIRGVVAEGPGPAVLADYGGYPTPWRRRLFYPISWVQYGIISFMNGVKPPVGILDSIAGIAPRPVLLIAAGKGEEVYFARRFYRAAEDPKALWEIPEAAHGGALLARPEAYADRVSAFFAEALGCP